MEFRKWSGNPPGGPDVVGRPFWRSGSGWETLPEFQNWSGDTAVGLELFGRPFWRFGSGRETLPEVWNWTGDPLKCRKWSRDPPGVLELVGRHSRSPEQVV